MDDGKLYDMFPHSWVGYVPYGVLVTLAAMVAAWKHVAKVATIVGTFVVDTLSAGYVIRKRLESYDARTEKLEIEVRDVLAAVRELSAALSSQTGQTTKSMLQDILDASALSAARLEAIADTDKVARFECAPDGGCTVSNKALCVLFGRSSAEMVGNGWLEAIHPEDRIPTFEAWRTSIENDVPYEHHYRIITPQGTVIPVVAKARTVRRLDRTPLAYLGTVTHPA